MTDGGLHMRTLALLLAGGFVLASCGSNDVTVAETADGKVTRSQDGTMNITTADGATATVVTEGGNLAASSAKVAASLPAHAPFYPGAKVVSTMTGSDGQGATAAMVVLETRDPMDRVTAFYDDKIAASGVKEQMKMDQAESATRILGETAGNGGTIIAINDGGDSRTISITAGGGERQGE